MKIGRATVPTSAICTSDDETIVVRGADLCRDLIGKLGFVDDFFLLVTGRRPDAAASRALDAMQGVVASGILGFPADALKGVPMLARTAGLIGHLTEELSVPIGFALSYQATREQQYSGERPAGWTPKAREA